MSQEVLSELVKALERGEEVALVTIVAAQGSTPQRVGAKMLVYPDGRIAGTIGGGCYENDALGKAREALLARKPRLVKYDLTDDFAEESGLICGGQMTVYIEPVEAAPQLYIVGGGHVGHQLAKVARPAGFRIHVLDDREKFANRERFPEADEVIVDSIPDWLHRADIPQTSYVVVVTRGPRHDLDALRSSMAGGPWRHQATNSSTWSSCPSACARTEPSGSLRIQPARASRVASRAAYQRKETPCT